MSTWADEYLTMLDDCESRRAAAQANVEESGEEGGAVSAYYNEIDPYCVEWLRNLIARNLIAPGDVDDRSIVDVRPDDLRGYDQCHFFAGIGGWSYALRLAGWPDDRPVWTGSCPCQPFSAAGKQRGSNDERHLWPAFYDLIRECRPPAVFGEQVAGAAGLAWLDHVCADLEESGYAVAAADLPACSVGAPHRRQRLWWGAESDIFRHDWSGTRGARWNQLENCCSVGSMADAEVWRLGQGSTDAPRRDEGTRPQGDGGGLADSGGERVADAERERGCGGQSWREDAGDAWVASQDGRVADAERGMGDRRANIAFWDQEGRDADRWTRPWDRLEWLPCSDGKARPTQPGLFPLAHGIPGRVGRLRAYGNAIVPQVAAEFVAAVMECRP